MINQIPAIEPANGGAAGGARCDAKEEVGSILTAIHAHGLTGSNGLHPFMRDPAEKRIRPRAMIEPGGDQGRCGQARQQGGEAGGKGRRQLGELNRVDALGAGRLSCRRRFFLGRCTLLASRAALRTNQGPPIASVSPGATGCTRLRSCSLLSIMTGEHMVSASDGRQESPGRARGRKRFAEPAWAGLGSTPSRSSSVAQGPLNRSLCNRGCALNLGKQGDRCAYLVRMPAAPTG